MEAENEIWKDIIEYEGLYQVSNYGRIRSLETFVNHRYGKRIRKGKIKTLAVNKGGYHTVNLFKDNETKMLKAHRALMQAFVPNPENKRTVNHKDGNKLNNHISNLEWATHKENNIHAHENNLVNIKIGEDNAAAHLSNIDILEIRTLSSNGIRHRTIAKVFDVHENTISGIVNRKTWNHI